MSNKLLKTQAVPLDLLITNCGELLTLASESPLPRRGKALEEIGLIQNGAVGILKGKIAWVGSDRAARQTLKSRHEINAEGKVVMPGFVDPHTHAVFAGSREAEWGQKLRGASYIQILKGGGGILSTVEATRRASPVSLYKTAASYLRKMFDLGTTTVEIKSGYGLDLANELKILRVIEKLKKSSPIDLISTFMGAHTFPKEYRDRPDDYVDCVVAMLPTVKKYAEFCDLFLEEGAFSSAQAEKIFTAARAAGFGIKLHAGQFSDQGGVALAVRHHAISVDHMDRIHYDQMPHLAENNIIGVLLPGVSHFLQLSSPPARALVAAGVPIALATDFNPGSSPCLSMQEVIHLAVRDFGLTPAEAIVAATLNAACALGLDAKVGSIEVGKQADLLLLDLHHYEQIPYFYGVNHVQTVIKKGQVYARRTIEANDI